VRERTVKATIAACVLGAAMVAVWAVARLSEQRPRAPGSASALQEAQPDEPSAAPPAARASRSPVRSRRPVSRGKPVGAPQVMPPARPILPVTGAPPAPAQAAQPRRPEEAVVRRVLEPLVARRPNAELPFVRCQDPGGWKSQASDETGESDDPLDVRPRDPDQAVCRARLQARDRGVLQELLRDASGAYQGHLVTTDVREHLDAYLGRWFQVDVQLDTEEPHPLPEPDP
jgi:hypothetical protein